MPSVVIESLANGGDGVAHLDDGRAVFVRGACPGDHVTLAEVEDHGRWASATVGTIDQPSPHRVTPPCPYFGVCGGCQWQHISAEAQLVAKRLIVRDALARIGRIPDADSRVSACLPSPKPFGYRNKVELLASTASGRLELGFKRLASDELVPIDRCLLMPDRVADAPKRLAGALRFLSGASDLGIERVAVRAARHRKDIEVALWTPPSAFPRDVAGSMLSKALGASSLVRVIAAEGRESRRPKVEVLVGSGFWRERMGEFTFTVSAPSFFQVNTEAAQLLVDTVLDALQPDGTDSVVDVFSGVGTFTLPLAEVAGLVTAVESSGSAVRDLRRNLESAGVYAEIAPGDAGRALGELGRFDLAVVDPPRAGLAPAALEALVRAKPRTIAYVSCDPATLARDSHALAAAGYDMASVTPVDLFPQTFHVESVSTFTRS